MTRRFQFSLRALLTVTAALALLLAICGMSWDAQLAYAKLLLYPMFFATLLVLLLLPAGAFAYKFGQCLLGCLPPDDLADAEPVRFDRPPMGDEG